MKEHQRKIGARIWEARQELVTVEADYEVRKGAFVRSKEMQASLLEKYKELSA